MESEKKANWTEYTERIEKSVGLIPAEIKYVERMTNLIKKAATKYIPRGHIKKYIPGWSKEFGKLL